MVFRGLDPDMSKILHEPDILDFPIFWVGSGFSLKKFLIKTYGHIFTSSSLDVAKPRSLLSVTTFKGSVHLDIADGAQSICAEIDVHNHELLIPEKK